MTCTFKCTMSPATSKSILLTPKHSEPTDFLQLVRSVESVAAQAARCLRLLCLGSKGKALLPFESSSLIFTFPTKQTVLWPYSILLSACMLSAPPINILALHCMQRRGMRQPVATVAIWEISHGKGGLAVHIALLDKVQVAHHWTGTAEVSRILAQVDQEKRTRFGKPNTGST